MRSSHSLDRVDVMFDDEHAVADAGLVLPATLAQHLGLRELLDERVDLWAHHHRDTTRRLDQTHAQAARPPAPPNQPPTTARSVDPGLVEPG